MLLLSFSSIKKAYAFPELAYIPERAEGASVKICWPFSQTFRDLEVQIHSEIPEGIVRCDCQPNLRWEVLSHFTLNSNRAGHDEGAKMRNEQLIREESRRADGKVRPAECLSPPVSSSRHTECDSGGKRGSLIPGGRAGHRDSDEYFRWIYYPYLQKSREEPTLFYPSRLSLFKM